MKLYHTWISHLFSLKILVLVVLDLCLPMPLCNLLAPEVTTILSGKCFWSSYNFTSSVLMTTYAHILVSIDLVRIGYGIGRRLQYGWVLFILLSSTEQDIKHKEKFMAQNLEGPSHSCSCCKHDMHWQVETYDALHISTPQCFGRWLPTNHVWWYANQMAMMTSCVFESWTMSLNVHFKSQKQNILLIMDKYATHCLW